MTKGDSDLRIIHIKTALVLCAVALLSFAAGCASEQPNGDVLGASSAEPGFLEELDVSDITSKLTEAWDTIGKDVLKDSVADVMDKLTDSESGKTVSFPKNIPEPIDGIIIKHVNGTVTVGEISADGYEAYIYMLEFNGYTAENGVYTSENGKITVEIEYDSVAETMTLSYI